MILEVELKFRLADGKAVEEQLRARGAVEQSLVTHSDRYFNHPSRNFRETDEAFRIRSVGATNFLTYKGAVIGSVAKTRHEIEVGIDDGQDAAAKIDEMVRLLGFRFVREVRKTRRNLSLAWQGHQFELAVDDVPPLGTFLEIELIAESGQREQAEKAVWELAHSLGLSVSEKRSYLDLLLESDGGVR